MRLHGLGAGTASSNRTSSSSSAHRLPSSTGSSSSYVVRQGWFAEAPSKVAIRWVVRGALALVGGAGLLFLAFLIPMSGLALVGGALIIGGVILLLLSRAMPAVTMPGAMIRAQLAAYRRTLKKTMEQSRSMDQVVADAGLEWLDTPDQAIVWGTALGSAGRDREGPRAESR